MMAAGGWTDGDGVRSSPSPGPKREGARRKARGDNGGVVNRIVSPRSVGMVEVVSRRCRNRAWEVR